MKYKEWLSEWLENYVGEVLAKLKEKGFDKNTLVIFTSDNGPHMEGGADPDFFGHNAILRGTKRQTHEGGVRVPFIAWGPGMVPAGVVNDHQLAFYDLMPTFCELAGVEDYVAQYSNPNKEVVCLLTFLAGQCLGKREAVEVIYFLVRVGVLSHIVFYPCQFAESRHEIIESQLMIIYYTGRNHARTRK